MLVDSHCHLNMIQDAAGAIKRAQEQGVKYMQTICTNLDQMSDLLKITNLSEGVFTSVGVHPCVVTDNSKIPFVSELVKISKENKVIAFGETGLDYYHLEYNKLAQIESFVNHIIASTQTGLPVIVHNRQADLDMSDILKSKYKDQVFSGLIHCFSSDVDFARSVLDIDFYISISGIVTFKNAAELLEVVKYVPLNRLLVETDTPYLAPVPMRGKKNEPAFVRFVAQKISEIKNLSIEEVIEQTTNNFFDLFKKAYRHN